MAIITISRQDGSLGYEIAEKLSQTLNMQFIVKNTVVSEWMPEVANKYQLCMLTESPKFYLTAMQDGIRFKEYIEKRLMDAAEKKPSVIVGMGSHIIFANHPDAIRIRIIASEQTRRERIKSKYGFGEDEANRLIEQTDKRHKKYVSTLYGIEWSDTLLYDLVLNTDHLTIDHCVSMIAALVEEKENRMPENIPDDLQAQTILSQSNHENAIFKHPAEEEFARILDMYGIEWEYEPRTFPVQWDAEGNVTMAFSPDFYLTKFDTYIEITTMEQKYVTTKNKKVKRLRELYPGININIVYKKDFHSLLKRFGFSGEDKIEQFNKRP